jgi:hypothetical protein
MITRIEQTAKDFSSHRCAANYPRPAPNVSRVAVGGFPLKDREAVIKACEDSAAELAEMSTRA